MSDYLIELGREIQRMSDRLAALEIRNYVEGMVTREEFDAYTLAHEANEGAHAAAFNAHNMSPGAVEEAEELAEEIIATAVDTIVDTAGDITNEATDVIEAAAEVAAEVPEETADVAEEVAEEATETVAEAVEPEQRPNRTHFMHRKLI